RWLRGFCYHPVCAPILEIDVRAATPPNLGGEFGVSLRVHDVARQKRKIRERKWRPCKGGSSQGRHRSKERPDKPLERVQRLEQQGSDRDRRQRREHRIRRIESKSDRGHRNVSGNLHRSGQFLRGRKKIQTDKLSRMVIRAQGERRCSDGLR